MARLSALHEIRCKPAKSDYTVTVWLCVCVKHSEELATADEWDVEYQGTCECNLKHKYNLGATCIHLAVHSMVLGRLQMATQKQFITLAEELITEHTNKHVTAAVQTCIHMNNANSVDFCLDGSLAMQTTKRDLRTSHVHPNDLARPRKADRKARLRASRHIPGKTKSPNYNLGNYSLVN